MLKNHLRRALQRLLKFLFRVELRGFEHARASGAGSVIICNHQSFLDPLLLAVFLPNIPAFAMNLHQARKWYFKPLLKLVQVFRVDPSQPMTTKSVIAHLRSGGQVVIFPEGRITTTGGIMKIYDGTGLILDKTHATVLPVHIQGAQYSKLSQLGGKVRQRWLPRITITFFASCLMELPPAARGKERRRLAAQWIYDLMTENMFRAQFTPTSLLNQLANSAQQFGMKMVVAEDINRAPVTYRSLFTRTFALAEALRNRIGKRRNVAVLMPTSMGGLLAFLALHRLGRIPAMLNFSSGIRNLQLACRMAEADTVITSRAFIARGKLQPLVEALQAERQVVYLEDVRKSLTLKDKLVARLEAQFPKMALKIPASTGESEYFDETAVILYTSGSEGTPKGVCLSHANLLANIYQAGARLSFTQRDVMFNALPIFHSFGLTIGTLLPLMLGIRTFLYPSPLHYRIIPELVYDTNATILLGTDTFFRAYANAAHAYDFHSLRLAVAGAEKLKPQTRALWIDRFRVPILEGYGVTEASPAIAFNTPLEHKEGTVGRPFPGIACRIEPVEGLESGGRLCIQGPNVMRGYIRAEHPGTLEPAQAWYDTGDIVEIDTEGYIHIKGRAKRFAKIGGEMVSLALAEELAATYWPDAAHAAIAMNDDRKGEHIILFTESAALTREQLLSRAQEAHLPEISVPKKIIHMEKLLRLGSGKIDYVGLKGTIA